MTKVTIPYDKGEDHLAS